MKPRQNCGGEGWADIVGVWEVPLLIWPSQILGSEVQQNFQEALAHPRVK